ncbi:hypothetical protein HDV01_005154 [Terramyces sp. JEL0728]|nr:hypothetical protein HDV01_005154 [Terramyces sp. JEL0728]
MYETELQNYIAKIKEKESEIIEKESEINSLKEILQTKKQEQVQKKQYDEVCFSISDYYSTKKTLVEINRINGLIKEIQGEIKEAEQEFERKKKLFACILSQIHSLKTI